MRTRIQLGDIAVDVMRKDIRNVHLSVHPPTGRVRIAAPARMNLDTIRVFAITKLRWIRRQQDKLQEQERETPREYLDRESHYVWGRRYLLAVMESDRPPSIDIDHNRIVLRVRPGTDRSRRETLMEQWYRERVKTAAPALAAKWERLMGVKVRRIFVQRMKTKWGSCNHRSGTIRLNTDLAKKPRECLEYIIVHEMAHLLGSTHNENFRALMDQFMPRWESRRETLNRLPVRHESWLY
jgi:predicted metal-dependent hydrolase